MALLNTSTGQELSGCYLRVCVADTSPVNLASKHFNFELSKDEAARNDNGVFKPKQQFIDFSFAEVWSLAITGATTLDAIATEAYSCLKLTEEYGASSDWVDA